MSPNLRPVLASPIGVSDHHSNSESWGWRVVQSRSSWAVARLQSLWNLWAIQFLQQCDGSNPSALQRSQQLMLQKVPWIPWVPRPAPLPCATWNAIAEWLGLVWWIPGKKCPKVDGTKKNAVKTWQKLAHLRYEIEVFPQPRHSFTCCISISSITSTQFGIVLDMPSQVGLPQSWNLEVPAMRCFP